MRWYGTWSVDEELGGWSGQVRLLNMARSGSELLYMNETLDDFSRYDREDSFERFRAVSPRPHWGDPIDVRSFFESESQQILAILRSEAGAVFVAGREEILAVLDAVVADHLGPDEDWEQLKSRLVQSKRWQELVY
ncbi:MAG: hypothetical protein U5K56_13405 [Halioglobus sp.]|nr:hypothetical protein [Halioglobus sp.]